MADIQTSVIYDGNGTSGPWTIPFEYLSKDYVRATLNGSVVPITFTTPNQASIPTAEGDTLVIQRVTDNSAPITVVQDDSTLAAADLNGEFTQLLHLAQEGQFSDGLSMKLALPRAVWGATGRRIADLAYPQDYNDAASRGFVGDAVLDLVDKITPGAGANYDYPSFAAVSGASIAIARAAIRVAGRATPGDGGETLLIRSAGNPLHPGSVQDASGNWWVVAGRDVSAVSFGADSTGAADAAPAIDAASKFVSDQGGGVVRLPRGLYKLMSRVNLYGNVSFSGEGMGLTSVAVGGTGFGFFGGTVPGALVDFEGMRWIGGNALVSNTGAEGERMTNIVGAKRVRFRGIHATDSRFMSLTTSGCDTVMALDCIVERTRRDAFNFKDSKNVSWSHCIVSRCGDAAFAAHTVAGTGLATDFETNLNTSITLTGCIYQFAFGAQLEGARNTTITGCAARFVNTSFVEVSVAVNEGTSDIVGLNIHGNSFLDLIDQKWLNGNSTSICRGIFITPPNAQVGTAGPVAPSIPGRITGGVLTKPEPYINFVGTNAAHAGGYSINISDNILANTITGCTVFEDAGFGPMYSNAGDKVNMAFTGTLGVDQTSSRAVYLRFGFHNVSLSNNIISGYGTAYYLAELTYMKNLRISGGILHRCRNYAIDMATATAALDYDAVIDGVTIDLDPYYEHPHHVFADGTWTNVSGTGASNSGFAINPATNGRGITVLNCKFKNCKGPIGDVNTGWQAVVKNCIYRGNPLALNGMAKYPNIRENILEWVESNPAAADFGTNYSPQNRLEWTAMPTTGAYMKGQFIPNANPVVVGGMMTLGWMRQTTAVASNVASTDWAAVMAAAG